jgi:spore coat protein U-like protein
MLRKLSAAFVAALIAAVPAVAAPLPVTADFQARAQVLANCTIVVSGDLNFGTYDPINANAATPLTGSTVLTVTCTRGSPSTVTMSASSNFGTGPGGAAMRAMLNGAAATGNLLSYELFQPTAVGASATASSNAWGDPLVSGTGTAFAVAAAPDINPRTVNVFGSIPAGQDVSTGNFADAVTATVLF